MINEKNTLRRWTTLICIVTFLCTMTLINSPVAAQESSDQAGPWVELFNGKDLSGWEQRNGTATYEVVEGAIKGTTAVGSPNSFLCTKKRYADFELVFETRLSDDLNSGVQIRSRGKEPSVVKNKKKAKNEKEGRIYGPQVEIERSGEEGAEAGYIYGEATGRNWLTSADDLKPHKHFKDGEWNKFRIVAKGPKIQTWINGQQISDLEDEWIYDTHPDGVIGLQVHGIGKRKGPFSVEWRNIKIREFPKPPLTHSFLGLGKANKVIIVGEGGNIEWNLGYPASDGWALSNGNVLLAIYPCKKYPQGAAIEINRKSMDIVFEYRGQQKEISTVQKLAEDRYLVAELGPKPRAIVVNEKGEITEEMPFECQKGNAHMQTRMLRILKNGNYIAPHLLDFAVKEYEPKSGKVVSTIATDERGREKKDWPFTAIRLPNGNTVIGCTNGNRVIEVDSDGKIVWSVDNKDLGEDLIDDACGVQRLPNGNTVITSYHAKGDSVKLFEVTRDKKVVWRYSGMKAGFHNFQILTTNGRALSEAYR